MNRYLRVIASLLIITTIIFAEGAGATQEEVKDMIKTAGQLYKEGEFEEAFAIYLKANAADPENRVVLERLGTIALWKNQIESAEKYLKRALRSASWYQGIWPFNVEINARLAMAYYRSDRFEDAAKLFIEAAGPISVGPLRELKAVGKQLALFNGATPYITDGPDITEIKFITTDPLPVVEVSVNGSEPYLFIIDTGGHELIIADDLENKTGIIIGGNLTGEFAGKKKASIGVGKADSIKLGEFTIRNVPVQTLDMASISSVFDRLDIKGVIGTSLLSHFLSTIDYLNGSLILRRKTPDVMKRFNARISSQKSFVLSFWLVETHLMFVWGSVNGLEPMLFLVDTGLADAGFLSSKSILQRAGATIDWSKARVGAGGGGEAKAVEIIVDEVAIGGESGKITKQNVRGVVLEKPLPMFEGQLGFKVGGLVSHQFFRDWALTFDFTKMRMILQKPRQ